MDDISSQLRRLYANASKRTVNLVERAKMTEHLFMIVLAVIIGLLAGYGAVGIRALIEWISEVSFSGEGTFLENVISAPWYVKILAPAIGGLIVGPIIYWFAPEAKGHGVPEVMQAVLMKGGVIRPRVAAVKAFASAITIGTGGSVGREGPIIQIGASIGSTVGQFFRLPSRRIKTLVGCGAAAGIAAAFNAPIAGALFAVEIILMDFAVAQFSPIVISSVMATVVSHHYEGNFPAFPVPEYVLASPYEIGFYFALGILSGLVSYLFIKVLYYFEDLWDDKFKIPSYLKATIGGLLVGSIALIAPEIMGIGYDSISSALNSNMVWYVALVLIFIKILATSLTLGSGGSGGIFAPALFMGAMVGAFFGHFAHMYFPAITAEHGAYAIVAMGGLVAGTTRAPITAIIIIFEMTKDYNIILPLMIVVTISMILSSKLSRESIYTLKLLHRKINIKERAEVNIMKSILVKDVYSKDFDIIDETMNFSEVVKTILSKKISYLSVKDQLGHLMGIVSIEGIKEYLFEKESLQYLLIAGDIADKKFQTLTPEDDCRKALELLGQCDFAGLPVVESDNRKKQIGIVWRKDIDAAYQKEIDLVEFTSDLAEKISINNAEKDVHFLEGYVITEIPVPQSFIGKSIIDLKIRNIYGVDIVSIKHIDATDNSIKAIPHHDHVFSENEYLIVAGEIEKINMLKNVD